MFGQRSRGAVARRCGAALWVLVALALAALAFLRPSTVLRAPVLRSSGDDRLLSATANTTLVVTLASYDQRDFVRTWIHHLQDAYDGSFLVGALDGQMLSWLRDRNVPHFATPGALDSAVGRMIRRGRARAAQAEATDLDRVKVEVAIGVLEFGFSALFVDVDAIVTNDPFPLFAASPDADLLYATDTEVPSTDDWGLEDPDTARWWYANPDVFYARPGALPLLRAWSEALAADPSAGGQAEWARLIKDGGDVPDDLRAQRLFRTFNGTVVAGVLPTARFCTPHSYAVARVAQRRGGECFVYRSSHLTAAVRRSRLREAGLFVEETSRYRDSAGFVAYKPSIPAELLEAVATMRYDGTRASAKPHFDLVQHQLKQLRNLFVLSIATGSRVFVLPEFVAGLDRHWTSYNGSIPDTDVVSPFVAPADQIVNIDWLEESAPGSWREAGFLERPETQILNGRVLTVHICESERDERCGNTEIIDDTMWVYPHGGPEEVEPMFEDVQRNYDVIYVASGIERLAKFTFDATKAYDGIKYWVGSWCCAADAEGPEDYDIYYDVVPHVDRTGKTVWPTID